MMFCHCHCFVLLVACGMVGQLSAADAVSFKPLTFPQGNTENRTGTWLSCNLGDAPAEVLPLKTRMWATRESVTDGVALKCVFEPGSKGELSFQNAIPPPAGC